MSETEPQSSLSTTSSESGGAPAEARVPRIEYVLDVDVVLAPTVETGDTWEGSRRIYPITGGTFAGSGLNGTVLAGADWNLRRSDGADTVEAIFYLQTDDGAVIRVVDTGCGVAAARDPDAAEHFLMFTRPRFEAPVGKYDWMNKTTFIGTIGQRRGASRQSTLLRVFKIV